MLYVILLPLSLELTPLAIAWHPLHSDILVSGGSEGSIIHWSMPDAAPKEVLEYAHDSNVWSLAFHPLGHLLCSASNDHTTRFWSRGRPGGAADERGDRFHEGRDKATTGGGRDEDGSSLRCPARTVLTNRRQRTTFSCRDSSLTLRAIEEDEEVTRTRETEGVINRTTLAAGEEEEAVGSSRATTGTRTRTTPPTSSRRTRSLRHSSLVPVAGEEEGEGEETSFLDFEGGAISRLRRATRDRARRSPSRLTRNSPRTRVQAGCVEGGRSRASRTRSRARVPVGGSSRAAAGTSKAAMAAAAGAGVRVGPRGEGATSTPSNSVADCIAWRRRSPTSPLAHDTGAGAVRCIVRVLRL